MSQLRIFKEDDPANYEELNSEDKIKAALARVGIIFERWHAGHEVNDQATPEEILKVYETEIEKLKRERGFNTADVISINPSVEGHPEMRKKFLSEHTHSDDEIRFFIDGKGLFTVHKEGKVFSILCEKNDLINVPAGTKHWFDMGPQPFFKCIRIFGNEEGWVANFTGSNIASRFPGLDD